MAKDFEIHGCIVTEDKLQETLDELRKEGHEPMVSPFNFSKGKINIQYLQIDTETA